MSASVLEHHLATCIDCARWSEAATRLTRQARLQTADVPDLSAAITSAVVLPAGRVLRRRLMLRAALLIAGLVQLALALPAIGGDSIGMAMSMHASHEAAAWGLALGAAFIGTSLAPRRAAGLIPLLSTFVVVLAALSVRDVAAGVTSVSRLSTHAGAVLGLLLVLALDRAERALPGGRFTAPRTRDHDEDGHGRGHGRGLRGVA